MLPLLVTTVLSLLPPQPQAVTVQTGAKTCFVTLPQRGRVRVFLPGASGIWTLEKSTRLVLSEGESWVSIYDAATTSWSDRRYVVHRTKAKTVTPGELMPACVVESSRAESTTPPAAPYCEAAWTSPGHHEIEVPLGGQCVFTIDGISRVAV